MGVYSLWETLAIGMIALAVLLWFRPGIRAALSASRRTEAHWSELVLPLGLVVLFVVFLIVVT